MWGLGDYCFWGIFGGKAEDLEGFGRSLFYDDHPGTLIHSSGFKF